MRDEVRDVVDDAAPTHLDIPMLDDAQRAVLALPPGVSAAVVGAPGTGKTTAMVELAAHRILDLGWDPTEVLVLTSSRVSATRLRDRLALRVARPTTGPLARTVNSLAFDIVGAAARADGRPRPTLITGGEQDADLAGLLEGHIEDGAGPRWPEHLSADVRRTRGFRTELRELLMRSTEHGISPARLKTLGLERDRPEWVAAGELLAEYHDVLGLQRPHQLDSTELVERAVRELQRGRPGDIAAPLRLVLVDDAQEATRSTLSVLAALAERGTAVVAFGNPDTAANAFRGGEADALGQLSQVLGVETRLLELGTVHRQGALLTRFVSSVTAHIGTAGLTGQRGATTAEPSEGSIALVEAPTPSRERSAIARRLRERHLMHGVAWSDMAVIVRSGAQVPAIARALSLAEVPTRTTLAARPLRDDGAARSLLGVVDIGMGRTPLTAAAAADLLLGPFGQLDRLDLRRLRLALRAEEITGGGDRGADALIVEALEGPGRFATIDHRSARRAERLAATLAAVRQAHDDDASIEELLWLAWERSGLHRRWYDDAMGSGIVADEAHRNLDGIVALFSAAKRFVERDPGAPARVFLDDVLDADVPEDTLSPQARGEAVLVTTSSGVVGLEFDTVALAGVQEGVWPNLRIRGTLLGAQDLARAAAGDTATLDERRLVRDDELRMFALAASRCRREIIVSSVANDDEAPSVFFSLVPDGAARLDATSPIPLSLRGLTGRLRHELSRRDGSAASRDAAAAALAHLADEAVPGADPGDWHGLLTPSTTEPVFDDDEQVPVSPSRLSAFEESPLDWFIDSLSGSAPSTAMSIGTIVHWAMETSEDTSVEGVWQAIESRWSELVFEAPWLAEKERAATRALAAGVAEYLGDFTRERKELIGAESRFELDVDRARVRGSIDRVERSPDGSVVIVDLKTGRPETKQSVLDAHPQLAAYQLAYAEGLLDEALAPHGGHAPGGAKLLFVKEGVGGKSYREGMQAPLTPEQLQEFRERIAIAARGMAAAAFQGSREIDDRRPGAAARRLHRVRAVTSD
ncbi:ATP-dependent helicase [Salinibacterium sp. GXW1014]|uniref:ATP-dependent helicase n=1 Tax=Salinibacterium sp. GXW1014 TaxID=3377838 RepID=UPI00383A3526